MIATVALLAEGVDRNLLNAALRFRCPVALLAEGVDRNQSVRCGHPAGWMVALLAEGVDRNFPLPLHGERQPQVALLAEGVDRNFFHPLRKLLRNWSPSSRRAWIEIEK